MHFRDVIVSRNAREMASTAGFDAPFDNTSTYFQNICTVIHFLRFFPEEF